MRALWNWVNVKWRWAGQNKLFWVNAALLILTGVIVAHAKASDFGIRAWSLALQLLGAYIVLRDLSGAAKDFGVPGIIERTVTWLKWGVGISTVVDLKVKPSTSRSSSTAIAEARVALDPNAPIEKRIAQLEMYAESLNNSITQAFKLIITKEREQTEKMRQAHAELEQALMVTNQRLKHAMVGNYSVLLFGAVWVAIGTILSTFAPDLTKLITGEWGFCPLPFDNIDALKFKFFAIG